MAETKAKTFTYRRVRYRTEPFTFTLQDLLEAAFDDTTFNDRIFPPLGKEDEDTNQFIFLNHKTKAYSGYYCGNLFEYERGKTPHILEMALDKEEIEPTVLVQLNQNQQLLDGILHFACFRDDLIICQSSHLRANKLERYLNEMFRRRCRDKFPQEQSVILERSIPRRNQSQLQSVKGLKITGPLDDIGREESEQSREELSVPPASQLWEYIRNGIGHVLGSGTTDLGGILASERLNATLLLSWRRTKEIENSDVIDMVANALRHVEDDIIEVEIDIAHGSLKYQSLQLFERKNVSHIDGLPNNGDIFDKMTAWHAQIAQEGDI